MQRRKYKKHKRPGSTGSKHWNWRHGKCSMETRKEHADTNIRLRLLTDLAIQGCFMTPATEFMGRPVARLSLPAQHTWVCVKLRGG